MNSAHIWSLTDNNEEPKKTYKEKRKAKTKEERLRKYNKDKIAEYHQKPNEHCKKCQIVMTVENTKLILRKNNSKGGYMLDTLCYVCRCKKQDEYNTARGVANEERVANRIIQDLKYADGEPRLSAWEKRMKENPVYFSAIFKIPATLENIKQEAKKLGV